MNHHDQVTAQRLRKLEHEMDAMNKRLIQLTQEFEKRTVHLAQQTQATAQALNALGVTMQAIKAQTDG